METSSFQTKMTQRDIPAPFLLSLTPDIRHLSTLMRMGGFPLTPSNRSVPADRALSTSWSFIIGSDNLRSGRRATANREDAATSAMTMHRRSLTTGLLSHLYSALLLFLILNASDHLR
ncbi:hypothetical protein AVEN_52457-1 [Araneus ventricosus]|uniref:Uncharacterized protein n=1 Tax=Araneus ventricosus TaxID=182803 RepID=A0A4Y2CXN4_ARAVE|nr:hypothetical protein AVEN_52457-1 [Araneus ventricosus]